MLLLGLWRGSQLSLRGGDSPFLQCRELTFSPHQPQGTRTLSSVLRGKGKHYLVQILWLPLLSWVALGEGGLDVLSLMLRCPMCAMATVSPGLGVGRSVKCAHSTGFTTDLDNHHSLPSSPNEVVLPSRPGLSPGLGGPWNLFLRHSIQTYKCVRSSGASRL